MVLKIFSIVCLLVSLADYFDLIQKLEAPARRLADWLWRLYPQYWHYVYHAKPEDMSPTGRFFAELGGTIWKLTGLAVLVLGGGAAAANHEVLGPVFATVLVGGIAVLLSPLVFNAVAWVLRLLSMPRTGIVATAGILLSILSTSIDLMR